MLARLGRRTAFGTPLALGVVARHGRWLGVTTDALPNGTLGWLDARTARLHAVATSLQVRSNPTAYAGPDQAKCGTTATTAFTLAGTATNGTPAWSVVSLIYIRLPLLLPATSMRALERATAGRCRSR